MEGKKSFYSLNYKNVDYYFESEFSNGKYLFQSTRFFEDEEEDEARPFGTDETFKIAQEMCMQSLLILLNDRDTNP